MILPGKLPHRTAEVDLSYRESPAMEGRQKFGFLEVIQKTLQQCTCQVRQRDDSQDIMP